MCTSCGCGTTTVNQDDNYGTINPYGIGGREVGSAPVEVKGSNK
jgi:hypothetical protein